MTQQKSMISKTSKISKESDSNKPLGNSRISKQRHFNKNHKSQKRYKNKKHQRIHNGSFDKLESNTLTFTTTSMSHDCRAVACYTEQSIKNNEQLADKQGKKVFVSFALPDEVVRACITNQKKTFEEADAIEILSNPNKDRQQPFCTHFGVCGGCSMQHVNPDAQITFKQDILAELLQNKADIVPQNWLPPIVEKTKGYRSKARLGVRYQQKKDKLIVGFRERKSNFLTDISECQILEERLNAGMQALKNILKDLSVKAFITHIEMASGETLPQYADGNNSVAMIIRHTKKLPKKDMMLLKTFFKQQNWQLYLQPQSANSIYRVNLENEDKKIINNSLNTDQKNDTGYLYFQLPKYQLTYRFKATDFTQVNQSVNRAMIDYACDLLALKEGEKVLDLFSGLGNFSLPMAKMVGGKQLDKGLVIGIEGSDDMTQRASHNAAFNQLKNTKFYTQDLTQDLSKADWAKQGFDALLIDPPRSGAYEVMDYIPKFNATRIVYVSCNPITLARDAKKLIDLGYELTDAAVMDMFCHTAHVESIVRFEKVTSEQSETLFIK